MNTNPDATTILCFGDSNTYGPRPDETGRYPANVRWTGLLQQALGGDYYVIEEGLGSRTTDLEYSRRAGRNGKTYLEPCLESHAPLDIVILMIGTNDLKTEFNRSPEDIAAAVRGLVELIQTKTGRHGHPSAKVLLVSPVYMNDAAPHFAELYGERYSHESVVKSHQLAAALQPVAQSTGCVFVDASQIAEPGDDGIHFTPETHAALAQALVEEVRKMRQ